MATTVTSNPASGTAYITRLQKILLEYQNNKNKKETVPDPYDKDPPRNIPSLSQETNDVAVDRQNTARSIGDLTAGKTRLNVISALTKNDLVDFYSFKLTQTGRVNLSITQDSNSDGKVSVQFLAKNGTVIADSEATSGTLYDNYKKLTAGDFTTEKGQYFVKVKRSTGELNTTKPNYAFQLSAGRYYEKDYQTIEKPVATSTTYITSIRAQNAGAFASVLNAFTSDSGGLFDKLV